MSTLVVWNCRWWWKLFHNVSDLLFFFRLKIINNLFRHITVIPPNTRHEPGEVPTEPYGEGNEDFNAGVKESKVGYPILELYELVDPVTLNELKARWGFSGPPQGHQYMKPELWEDRWGERGDRSEKVKKVF